jgi:AraC-like DNA-binding protein
MASLSIRPWVPLQPFIERLVIFDGGESSTDQSVRILPRPNVVLGLQYGEPVQLIGQNGNIRMFRTGLTGLQSWPRHVQVTTKTGFILVYFKPGGASAFLPCSMAELTDQHADLGGILPLVEVNEIFQRVLGATTRTERASILQKFLVNRLTKEKTDQVVLWAVSRLQDTWGTVPIRELAREFSISQRQLERRFRAQIGFLPKQFAMLCRFRYSLQMGAKGLPTIEIAHRCGFFDQAHFTRQFKDRTGLPPKNYFSCIRPFEIP